MSDEQKIPQSTVSGMNRRSFLGSSARNAATAAAGAVVGLSQLSSASAGAASAQNQIRVGVVGVRNQGLELARVFHQTPGCEVVGLCDVDSDVLAKAATELQFSEGTGLVVQDARKLFDQSDIDAVIIATPDHHHAWMAAMAAAAGKHVYLEVPVTHQLGEAGPLRGMLERAGVVVQTGLQHRSAAHYRTAVEFVRAGYLGTVHTARAWVCVKRQPLNVGQPGQGSSWSPLQRQMWLGQSHDSGLNPADWHFHWRWLWEFGAGELGTWGVHLLDLARWGLSEEQPQSVTASGGCYYLQDGRETPDTLTVQYDFPKRSILWEHRQWTQRGIEGRPHGVAFYGDAGTLIVDRSGWKVYDGKRPYTHSTSKSLEPHAANFVAAIRGQATLAAEFSTGLLSSSFCHWGNQSYRRLQTIVPAENNIAHA